MFEKMFVESSRQSRFFEAFRKFAYLLAVFPINRGLDVTGFLLLKLGQRVWFELP